MMLNRCQLGNLSGKIKSLRGIQQTIRFVFYFAAAVNYKRPQNMRSIPKGCETPKPGKDFVFARHTYDFWVRYCKCPGSWTEHGVSQREAETEAIKRTRISFYKTLRRQS